MSRFLVTGAGGMLGSVFCRQLKDKNEIYGIDIKPGFIEIDIAEKQVLWDFIKKTKPEVIVHTAAYTDVDGCELDPKIANKINAIGTKNLAEACKDIGALMVYISTDYVFDGEKDKPYTEIDLSNPINVYGKSKLQGEEYVKNSCGRFLIIRSSGLFGKNGRNFVDTILKLAALKEDLKVVDDQRACPTYVDDLAKAVIKLVSLKKEGIYHVANSGVCSWYEFAEKILKISGIKKEVIPIKTDKSARAARRPKMSALCCDKYVEAAGKPMRHGREALKDYLKEIC